MNYTTPQYNNCMKLKLRINQGEKINGKVYLIGR